jgi:hypothetical protein
LIGLGQASTIQLLLHSERISPSLG